MAEPEKLKVVLLVGNRALSKWQEDALIGITDLVEVVLVLNCTNTSTRKHIVANAAYYALNMVSIKSPLTRKRSVDFGDRRIIDFESRYDGAWQWIPDDVVAALAGTGAKVVIKFGMSLLRMDNLTGVDVLSFHHGDPRHYRGRPAGFYELLDGAESVGFIVQKLSNVLDGGQVLALGRAKIYDYSYRQTLQGLYRSSPALLRHAIQNYLAGMHLPIEPKGKNYRLPGNGVVLGFCMRLFARKIKRLVYGGFWEKRWNIVVKDDFDFRTNSAISVSSGRTASIPAKYNFYADPFLSADGSTIRAEALVATTGRGEIVEIDAETMAIGRTLLAGPHFSYPYTFVDDGQEFVLPEVAGHEAPYLLQVSGTPRKVPLLGLEHLRLVDPSMVKFNGHYYLFSGDPQSAAGMLQLYVADTASGPYRPHRMNPVVIDPCGARMGGKLLVRDGKLYRFGQDNSGAYGNGIFVMEVCNISPDVYEEREIGQLRFSDASGPHTVDVLNGRAVLDFYVDKFSLLAGYRRFIAKVHARLAQRSG